MTNEKVPEKNSEPNQSKLIETESKEKREKVSYSVPDITGDEVQHLKKQFPQVFTDVGIDFEKLKTFLGNSIDKNPDRFTFSWAGKRDSIQILQMPTRSSLKPMKEESISFDSTENIFIEGDNLEVLKLLYKPYFNRIKLIYIDPPYNTGNDFIYQDNYADPLDTYLKLTGQKSEEGDLLTSNPETSGRFHSSWLSMLYPRLFLARQLLQDDGAIVISIDDHEVHNLRKVLDEIFGEENFIGQITLQSNPRGSQASKFLANVHEFLLIYCKNQENFEIKGYEIGEQTKSEFNSKHIDGRMYRLLGLRQRGGAWKREQRPKLFFPIYVNPSNNKVSLTKSDTFSIEVLPKRPTGEEGRWKWGKEKIKQNLQYVVGKKINREGEENAWDIFHMDFLETVGGEVRTSKPKTIWIDKELNYQNGRSEIKRLFSGKDIYDFPKPTYLVRKILKMFDLDGEIVLDFFAGSGTTAHSVLLENFEERDEVKFISVQLPEPVPKDSEANEAGYSTISQICEERIKKSISELVSRDPSDRRILGLGVKFFKLTKSNYRSFRSLIC